MVFEDSGIEAAAKDSGGATDNGSLSDGTSIPVAPCSGSAIPQFMDIWSDARGPFLMASVYDYGTVVLSKETGKWKQIYHDASTETVGITGFPGGDLVLAGGPPETTCGPIVLYNGVAECSGGFLPTDFFAVSTNLAYALASDRVLAYDGSTWTQYLDPFPAPVSGVSLGGWDLWASNTSVVATTIYGDFFISRNGAAFAEEGNFASDPPSSETVPAVWGFADNDIWVGVRATGELYSYDGVTWTERATLVDSCGGGIRDLWGDNGVLYLRTAHQFARFSDGKLEVLYEFPCSTTIKAIWGNSVSEVYLAVEDPVSGDLACGTASVFLWTGTDLVRL